MKCSDPATDSRWCPEALGFSLRLRLTPDFSDLDLQSILGCQSQKAGHISRNPDYKAVPGQCDTLGERCSAGHGHSNAAGFISLAVRDKAHAGFLCHFF